MPEIIGTLPVFELPDGSQFVQATHVAQTCGKIEGGGTISSPLKIKLNERLSRVDMLTGEEWGIVLTALCCLRFHVDEWNEDNIDDLTEAEVNAVSEKLAL